MFSHEAVYRLPGAFCPLTIVRTPRFFVLALSSTEFQCLALFEDVFLIFKVLMVPPCHVYFCLDFLWLMTKLFVLHNPTLHVLTIALP